MGIPTETRQYESMQDNVNLSNYDARLPILIKDKLHMPTPRDFHYEGSMYLVRNYEAFWGVMFGILSGR